MVLGRPQNSTNKTHYRFEVILDNQKKLCRTIKEVAAELSLGIATISRKLNNPELKLTKYKDKTLIINRVKLPIYETQLAVY
tara:strand:+ start:493 stop:738 length:246 start_codon:yes stop_codon:yes gene_type:complete